MQITSSNKWVGYEWLLEDKKQFNLYDMFEYYSNREKMHARQHYVCSYSNIDFGPYIKIDDMTMCRNIRKYTLTLNKIKKRKDKIREDKDKEVST